jgi:hypothetical protein
MVVPLVLLVIAVSERVSDYGVTPERFGLALFALFLGLVLIVQVAPRWRGDIRFIPALGALVLFFASFGPWGIVPVTVRSQTDRLMHILADAGSLQNGELVAEPVALSADATRSVRTIVPLLGRLGQLDRLQGLFAGRDDDPFAEGRGGVYDRVANALNARFAYMTGQPSDEGFFDISSAEPEAVPIVGYDVAVVDLPFSFASHTVVPLDGTTLRVGSNGRTIVVTTADGTTTHSIDSVILRDAIEERLETIETVPVEDRPPFLLELTLEGRKVAVLFKNVGGTIKDSQLTLKTGSFDLFLRSADWTPQTSEESGGLPLRGSEP